MRFGRTGLHHGTDRQPSQAAERYSDGGHEQLGSQMMQDQVSSFRSLSCGETFVGWLATVTFLVRI